MSMEQLLQSEEFVEKMHSVKSLTEAAGILGEYGIAVSEKDLALLQPRDVGEELHEEDLEQVAGGSSALIGFLIRAMSLIPMPVFPHGRR